MSGGKSCTYVINSPFQLLCAIEAREKFGVGATNNLVVLEMGEFNSLGEAQVRQLIDGRWDSVTSFPFGVFRGFARLKRKIRFFQLLICGMSSGERYFLGNGRLKWLRGFLRLISRNVVELDDGAASIFLLKNRRLRGGTSFFTYPEYFSVFAESVDDPYAVKNTLNFLARGTILSDEARLTSQTRVFIGQKLSEAGILKIEDEIGFILQQAADLRAGAFLYISHRGDSGEKIARLKSEGVEVIQLGCPIEVWFRSNMENVNSVVSFYSTALFTARLILPTLSATAIEVGSRVSKVQERSKIDVVLDFYCRNGIRILREM